MAGSASVAGQTIPVDGSIGPRRRAITRYRTQLNYRRSHWRRRREEVAATVTGGAQALDDPSLQRIPPRRSRARDHELPHFVTAAQDDA